MALSESQERDLEQLKVRFHLSDEAAQLIREDWEYGLTSDQTKVYLKPGMKYWQMKYISECLRKEHEEGLIDIIGKYSGSKDAIRTAITLYEDGMPIAEVEKTLSKTRNAAQMKQIYIKYKEKVGMEEKKEDVKETTDQTMQLTKEKVLAIGLEISGIRQEMATLKEKFESRDEEIRQLCEESERIGEKLREVNDKLIAIKKEREKKRAIKPEMVKTQEADESDIGQNVSVMYNATISDNDGKSLGSLPIERTVRKTSGLAAIAAALGFKKKSRREIVRLVSEGKLSPDQLMQIKLGIDKGLSEYQLTQLICCGGTAEQMKEIVEIAEHLNAQGYE